MTLPDDILLPLGTAGLIVCIVMVLLTLFTLAWTEYQRRKPLLRPVEEIDWPRSWKEVASETDTAIRR